MKHALEGWEQNEYLQFGDGAPEPAFPGKKDRYLKQLAGQSVDAAILYVDIVGSTQMCFYLSPTELEHVIKLFWREMSDRLELNNGMVFKYVGDAVIGIFPQNSNVACNHAIECAKDMIRRVQTAVNTRLMKEGIPGISIKVGIDYGKSLVVSNASRADLIGFTISISSKITCLAMPDSIVIGQSLFEVISRSQTHGNNLQCEEYHVIKWPRWENNRREAGYRVYSVT